MPRQQMEKLTVDQCAEAALALEDSRFICKDLIIEKSQGLTGQKALLETSSQDERVNIEGRGIVSIIEAANEDGYTKKLLAIKKYAQQPDRLTYLASSVKNLSDLYINLQRAKISRNG